MQISSNGLALIKHFEGCKIKAYKCSAGVWTIGYGSTGSHVYEGKMITEQEASNLLFEDVERFERQVDSLDLPLEQYQFDALVSFAFNLGFGSLLKSTLLKKLKAGDIEQAAKEFLKWNKVGGVVLQGLVKRREAESKLFNGEEWS
jgi:lysozyme